MSSTTIDAVRLKAALKKATEELLAERTAQGFWEGDLSSSALSTATAVTALAVALKHGANPQPPFVDPQSSISAGLNWLAAHQNADGGWGDTTKSLSNISTTTLCWAAFGAAGADRDFPTTIQRAERWLAAQAGVPDSAFRAPHSALARAIIARYGKDRTFSVPILTMCALAGRLGEGRAAWEHVIPLPFELAACPHQLFAALRLPVVSYALPALIAIGQARHVHAPTRNPITRFLRDATRAKTLWKLSEIQPENGGFLEATPLTSFVTMSLAGSGQADHVVTRRGLEFLLKSQRGDGSWPIDTNLATWCTTLAIDALPESSILDLQRSIPWLLNQQYRIEHPYTHAAPGGWAWTDLPGGVPDADDTAGALLALWKMRNAECGMRNEEITRAAEMGICWLLELQNRDGGIPTFCRGWGALPFDRSSADITAHVVRAWNAWRAEMPAPLQSRMDRGTGRALTFLKSVQRADGAWSPLWFGNQFNATEENLTYGTANVVRALGAALRGSTTTDSAMLNQGASWLLSAQNADGSWSGFANGPASVEETALAVSALTTVGGIAAGTAVSRGTEWLMKRVESGAWREPAPIGFYFAKLWYFERLYPMIFTVGALRSVGELNRR